MDNNNGKINISGNSLQPLTGVIEILSLLSFMLVTSSSTIGIVIQNNLLFSVLFRIGTLGLTVIILLKMFGLTPYLFSRFITKKISRMEMSRQVLEG